jgi:hypothetical protein
MSVRKNHHLLWLVGVFLLLAALACGAPTTLPTAAPQTGETNPTATPPAATDAPGAPVATGTPVPGVTAAAGCTLNAAWVADVTVPDNTQFAPGTAFVKTWRVRNSGTCDWEAGTQLAFASGDQMGGPASVSVTATVAGGETDISVNLTAPASPGTYKGNWQLQAPDGTRFGSIIYAKIVVPAPTTATPTSTPTPTPTQTPTPGGCAIPIDPTLQPALDRLKSLYPAYDLGCPTQAAFNVQGAFQEFWANVDNANPNTHYRSLMIWRSDNREIYVIDGNDTNASQGMLLAYTDIWVEGQDVIPPACAGMTVPAGYQLPVRGFGKVWCANSLVNPVGWPAVGEVAVNLFVQPMQTGQLLKVTGPIPIFYLIALDYRGVLGVTQMVSP